MSCTPLDLYLTSCKELKIRKPNREMAALFAGHEREGFQSVQVIDASKTYLGPRGIVALVRLCPSFPNLRELKLDNQMMYNADERPTAMLGNDVVKELASALELHPSISKVSLRNNDIATEGFTHLLLLAQRCPTLIHIDVAGCRIEANDIAMLASVLEAKGKAPPEGRRTKKMPTCGSPSVAMATQPMTVTSDFPTITKSKTRMEEISHAIQAHPLLRRMPPDHQDLFLRCAFYVRLTPGEVLLDSGDEADAFYLTVEGVLECMTADGIISSFQPGSTVGEVALLAGPIAGPPPSQAEAVRRSATCRASLAGPVIAYGIERDVYNVTVRPLQSLQRARHSDFVAGIPSLSSITQYAKLTLCDAVSLQAMSAHTLCDLASPDVSWRGSGGLLVIMVDGKAELCGRHLDLLRGDILVVSIGDSAEPVYLAAHEPHGARCLTVPVEALRLLHPALYPSLSKSARHIK